MSFERWENKLADMFDADPCERCEDEECTCSNGDDDYDDPDTYYDGEDYYE